MSVCAGDIHANVLTPDGIKNDNSVAPFSFLFFYCTECLEFITSFERYSI